MTIFLPFELAHICRSALLPRSTLHSIRFSSTRIPSSSSSSAPSPPNAKLADKRWPGWTPTIGLELHVQLKGNLKLFSPATALYETTPNTQVAPFDAALPGSLPVLQTEPVRLALLACLALKCDINTTSTFDRKHYFYPDLPAGFQITQKYSPLATGGVVRIQRGLEKYTKPFSVRIEQIQLEQDTAKSFHDPETHETLIDLNRAGAALIEIVTKPDMSTPEQAAQCVRQLQSVLRHVGASDANMERGELRCDVNVSVKRSDGEELGARREVKNLNGVRYLMGAIESEIQQQIDTLSAGEPVLQSTRGYNVVTGTTFHLRSKEDAPDYRYMPDPELGPVRLSKVSRQSKDRSSLPLLGPVSPSSSLMLVGTFPAECCLPLQETLERLRSTLPELPDDAFIRLQSEYGLGERDAGILVSLGEGLDSFNAEGYEDSSVKGAALGVEYFEEVAKGRDSKVAANWVLHELLGQLGKVGRNLANSPVSPDDLGELIDAVTARKMTGQSTPPHFKALRKEWTLMDCTGTNAKAFLSHYLSMPRASTSLSSLLATEITSALALNQDDLHLLCTQVISDLSKEAEKVRKGNEKVLMRLVGEVMKRSKGKADAVLVQKTLREALSGKDQ